MSQGWRALAPGRGRRSAAIAAQVSFSDATAFSRTTKAHFGQSPRLLFPLLLKVQNSTHIVTGRFAQRKGFLGIGLCCGFAGIAELDGV